MTDGRVSRVHAEVSQTPTPAARISQEVASVTVTPAPGARISRLHAGVTVNPASECRVSRVSMTVAVTVLQPYLQDMNGNIVNSLHAGGVIRPIRSLVKTNY